MAFTYLWLSDKSLNPMGQKRRSLGLHPSRKGSFSVGGGGLCQSVLMLHTVAGSINP